MEENYLVEEISLDDDLIVVDTLLEDEISTTVDFLETEMIISSEVDTINYSELIYNDVHMIMVFLILTFCSSCLRSWRINSRRGMN